MISNALQILINRTSAENALHEETKALSLIDTNLISVFDNGHRDPICREKLIDYLARKNQWKSINDLFSQCFPMARNEIPLLTFEQKAGIIDGSSRPLKPEFQSLLCGYGDKQLYFNTVQGLYLNLQDNVVLDKDAQIDRDFFGYFFAYRLSKKEPNEILNFLLVTFTVHFNEEIISFLEFCRHEIIPNYRALLGTKRIAVVRAFMKKVQSKAPYSRIKEVKLKEKSLDEFFNEGFNGKKNAELFRTQIIHGLLEKEGKQIPRAKEKLNMVVNYLFYQNKIWRQDLELKTIADTLKKELRFKTLNPKGYQKDQIKDVDGSVENFLSKINWIKSR